MPAAPADSLFKLLLEAIEQTILVHDVGGRVLAANRRACELLGYSETEIVEQSLSDLLADYPPETTLEQLLRVRREGRYVFWATLSRRDGQGVFAELNGRILDRSGHLAVLTITMRQDGGRNRDERRFQESEETWRTLVNSNPESLLLSDAWGTILYANRIAASRLGRPGADLGACSLWDVLPAAVVPDRREKLQEVLRTGKSVRFLDSQLGRTTENRLAPVLDDQGRVARVAWLSIDETGRRELQEQVLASQRLEAVGRLAGGIAHDFNNILTVISSFAGFALEGLGAEDPRREDIEEIRSAAGQATTLIRQLLAFSRKQVLQPRSLNLNELVRDTTSLLRRLLGEDIELRFELAAELGKVEADRAQIEQVLANLAVNAREAMPNGGKLTIETSNVDLDDACAAAHVDTPSGPHVLLAVTDTGVGMDEVTRAHLFEPFFTTSAHGKGTGLGLASVYGVVRQSGGHVGVYSEPGAGATFKIYLPRCFSAEDAEPVPTVR